MATHLPAATETRSQYWRRVLRPLHWWLLLVLVLYGIRLHQRLSAQTNLKFTAEVPGQPFFAEASAELDGKPFASGQRVRLGWHQLALTHPKGNRFATNLFVWYGERNLGKIVMARAQGTLVLSATPVAQRLVIRGPEFSTTLTNSSGFNSLVPTDRYVVEATYRYWQDATAVEVSKDTTATYRFAPRFGSLSIEASHPDISFVLRKADGTLMETGQLPTTIVGLPEASDYQLRALRKEDSHDNVVTVTAGQTNTLKIEFVYGVVTIESEPTGATVLKDDNEIGRTPLTLPEVKPGTFKFSLRLDEYETANRELSVIASQTNAFRYTLISQHFTRAMTDARQFYANAAYPLAIQAATEALKYKAGDAEATNLLHDATMMEHLAKAQSWAARGEFTNAITEANAALALAPDNAHAKELVADYTNREQQRLDAIRKREAELAEQARLRQEQELAEQHARERTKEFVQEFSNADARHEDANLFSTRELTETNFPANKAADNIVAALRDSPITFDNAQVNWITSYMFTLEPRQRMTPGYRSILIMGCQTRDNEVRIRFKVYEYEHEHIAPISLLGGMLQVKAQASVTSQDPQVAAANAQKFRMRIKAGVDLVQGLIVKAVSQP